MNKKTEMEDVTENDLKRLQAEHEQLKKYADHLHNTITSISRSYAWRMTKPLRVLEIWTVNHTPAYANRIKKLIGVVLFKPVKKVIRILRKNQKGTSGEATSAPPNENQDWRLATIEFDNCKETTYQYSEHERVDLSVKLIAHYLPQFHPFAENDEWWGKGFTEWHNVSQAQPLFEGHQQPKLPTDLGFYDLRVVETMREQAKLARNYGIHAFAYYFYWFSGKTLMERPLRQMLNDPSVDIPFCLTWANENWTRRWDGQEEDVLISQDYTHEDAEAFIDHVLEYMADERYLKINQCPVLIVYRPNQIPQVEEITELWRKRARESGHKGLYLIASSTTKQIDFQKLGFDATQEFPPATHDETMAVGGLTTNTLNKDFKGAVFNYPEAVNASVRNIVNRPKILPCVMLGWDNTARRGLHANIFVNFKLLYYKQWLTNALFRCARDESLTEEEKVVFINAWNEWAEGTYLEPDLQYGHGYLETTHEASRNFESCYAEHVEFRNTDRVNDQAIIIHIHYEDVLPQIHQRLQKLSRKYDLYITCTSRSAVDAAVRTFPDAFVRLVENRGRDILPFIETLKHISSMGYEYCCKIHSKKSVYRKDGNSIRNQLFMDLLSNDKKVHEVFCCGDHVGIIASDESLLRHDQNNMALNGGNIKTLCQKIGIDFQKSEFPAGSMYWFKPEALNQLTSITSFDFDIEKGHSDGTLAHAVERIITVLARHNGYQVVNQRGETISTISELT